MYTSNLRTYTRGLFQICTAGFRFTKYHCHMDNTRRWTLHKKRITHSASPMNRDFIKAREHNCTVLCCAALQQILTVACSVTVASTHVDNLGRSPQNQGDSYSRATQGCSGRWRTGDRRGCSGSIRQCLGVKCHRVHTLMTSPGVSQNIPGQMLCLFIHVHATSRNNNCNYSVHM